MEKWKIVDFDLAVHALSTSLLISPRMLVPPPPWRKTGLFVFFSLFFLLPMRLSLSTMTCHA